MENFAGDGFALIAMTLSFVAVDSAPRSRPMHPATFQATRRFRWASAMVAPNGARGTRNSCREKAAAPDARRPG